MAEEKDNKPTFKEKAKKAIGTPKDFKEGFKNGLHHKMNVSRTKKSKDKDQPNDNISSGKKAPIETSKDDDPVDLKASINKRLEEKEKPAIKVQRTKSFSSETPENTERTPRQQALWDKYHPKEGSEKDDE